MEMKAFTEREKKRQKIKIKHLWAYFMKRDTHKHTNTQTHTHAFSFQAFVLGFVCYHYYYYYLNCMRLQFLLCSHFPVFSTVKNVIILFYLPLHPLFHSFPLFCPFLESNLFVCTCYSWF